MSDERVEVIGDLMNTSPKAVCIKFTGPGGDSREEWFPRSQISDQDWVDEAAKVVKCSIPRWLAEDRGVV